MAHSDASDVDAAIVSVLLNDPTLKAILPDGVYFNVAYRATRCVVIGRTPSRIQYQFGGMSWQELRYQIEAIALESTGADVKQAAYQIDELLRDNFALPITGWKVMNIARDAAAGDIRETEIDPQNTAMRWQHRGAYYLVQVCPTGPN